MIFTRPLTPFSPLLPISSDPLLASFWLLPLHFVLSLYDICQTLAFILYIVLLGLDIAYDTRRDRT